MNKLAILCIALLAFPAYATTFNIDASIGATGPCPSDATSACVEVTHIAWYGAQKNVIYPPLHNSQTIVDPQTGQTKYLTLVPYKGFQRVQVRDLIGQALRAAYGTNNVTVQFNTD